MLLGRQAENHCHKESTSCWLRERGKITPSLDLSVFICTLEELIPDDLWQAWQSRTLTPLWEAWLHP